MFGPKAQEETTYVNNYASRRIIILGFNAKQDRTAGHVKRTEDEI
jgi:hypothetical protein